MYGLLRMSIVDGKIILPSILSICIPGSIISGNCSLPLLISCNSLEKLEINTISPDKAIASPATEINISYINSLQLSNWNHRVVHKVVVLFQYTKRMRIEDSWSSIFRRRCLTLFLTYIFMQICMTKSYSCPIIFTPRRHSTGCNWCTWVTLFR